MKYFAKSHANNLNQLYFAINVIQKSFFKAPGGRVTDYRLEDLGDLMKSNRLAPWYGKRNTIPPHPDDPLEKAYHRLTRYTLKCPLTKSSTTICNMVSILTLKSFLVLLYLILKNRIFQF